MLPQIVQLFAIEEGRVKSNFIVFFSLYLMLSLPVWATLSCSTFPLTYYVLDTLTCQFVRLIKLSLG